MAASCAGLKTIPEIIVHYSRGEPFRSLTAVPHGQRDAIVGAMSEANAWGIARFSDPKYLAQRFEVERRLRAEFIDKGGRPRLENPVYFFLGNHAGFETHGLNKKYVLRLDEIPSEVISFTYGDSMLAYAEENRLISGEKYKNSLCAKIFRKEELPALFRHPEFPVQDPLNIEVQLWISDQDTMSHYVRPGEVPKF